MLSPGSRKRNVEQSRAIVATWTSAAILIAYLAEFVVYRLIRPAVRPIGLVRGLVMVAMMVGVPMLSILSIRARGLDWQYRVLNLVILTVWFTWLVFLLVVVNSPAS